MSLLAILLISQTASPKAILDRYAQYRKDHPTIAADWTLTVGGQSVAHGTIMVDGVKRMLFKAASGKDSYSLSETEKGIIEITPANATYDEYPAVPILELPPSKLGAGVGFVPIPLTGMSAFSTRVKYSVDPPIMVNGESADEVTWTVQMDMQAIRYTLAVDAQGRIVRMTRLKLPGGPGPGSAGDGSSADSSAVKRGFVWTISNYRPIPHPTMLTFYTPLPKGFVPFNMPPLSLIRIGVDEAFPSVPWKTANSMVDLRAEGKPQVILITAPDCAPSQKALANLDKIKADVPGVGFEAVSLARSAGEAHGLPYDSTGKAAAAIGETSTPLFVLVDGSGKIKNLWAGFDPDGVSGFAKQISDAVKKLSASV